MATTLIAPSVKYGDKEDAADAFRRWRMAHRAIERGNPDDDDSQLWTAIDAAENTIEADSGASNEAAERKLWLALAHMLVADDDCRAVNQGNTVPLVAKSDTLDWPARLVLSAIVSLRSARGEA